METQQKKKLFLIISGVFIGIVVYVIADIMMLTTPPWKKKKRNIEIAQQDSLRQVGLDSVYLTNFSDTLIYEYRVGKNEVLGKIAEKFNTKIDSLKSMNQLSSDNIIENQKLSVRIRAIYRVKQGDIISTIAKRYGVESEDILQANNIKNAKQLWADQILAIPLPKK
ncbi:MAG: LysM peptidoglycan-binding domain-containing protein [Cytophagales bacterium]|nr:MAG: LysM peptidoglycan-binding domain-containing protein [Cytophagales bacterium]